MDARLRASVVECASPLALLGREPPDDPCSVPNLSCPRAHPERRHYTPKRRHNGPAGRPATLAGRHSHSAGRLARSFGRPGKPFGRPAKSAGHPAHPFGRPGKSAGPPNGLAGRPASPAGRPARSAGRPSESNCRAAILLSSFRRAVYGNHGRARLPPVTECASGHSLSRDGGAGRGPGRGEIP